MPHAIYLHSALARDRHGRADRRRAVAGCCARRAGTSARALVVAGRVNIAMLLLAASSLRGIEGTDSIEGAHAAIERRPRAGRRRDLRGRAAGVRARLDVGRLPTPAPTIMQGLLRVRIPLLLRRVVTLVPALVLLAIGARADVGARAQPGGAELRHPVRARARSCG